MRATALSFGALKALRDTSLAIPKEYLSEAEATTVPLINEVDYVSAVSGGSATAAYWPLLGPQEGIGTFRKQFLDSNVRWEFTKFVTEFGNVEVGAKRLWKGLGGWFTNTINFPEAGFRDA